GPSARTPSRDRQDYALLAPAPPFDAGIPAHTVHDSWASWLSFTFPTPPLSTKPGQLHTGLLSLPALCSLPHRRLLSHLGNGVVGATHSQAGQGAAATYSNFNIQGDIAAHSSASRNSFAISAGTSCGRGAVSTLFG